MINEELNNMPVPEAGQMPMEPEAPVGPEVPMEPEVPEGAEAPADEASMRAELDRGFEDVENKNRALETQKFISRNKIKNFKMQLLKELFAMLEEAGVDPNDPESIRNFLASLEEQDPDMAVLFETAFDNLSPESMASSEVPQQMEQPVEPEGGNLMDKYSNLQDQIMR